MRKLILSLFLLLGCAQANDSPVKWNADKHDYKQYHHKVVESMNYCDGCGPAGDILYINFTDGSKLKVYAYKYTMSIIEP